MRLRLAALAAVAAALLLAPAVPAAAQRLAPADQAEVDSLRLAPRDVDRFLAVVRRMEPVFAADPRAFEGLERRFEGDLTLAQAAAWYDEVPAMRAALAAEGVPAREFVRTASALLAARAATNGRGTAPEGNVRLFRAREEAVSDAFAALRTMARERPATETAGAGSIPEFLALPEELSEFVWTDVGVEAFELAVEALAAVHAADPAPFRAQAAGGPVPREVERVTYRLLAIPAAADAVDGTGMSVEDFARWLIVFSRVSLADAYAGDAPDALPADAPPALRMNLDYWRRNRARMEAIRRRLASLET